MADIDFRNIFAKHPAHFRFSQCLAISDLWTLSPPPRGKNVNIQEKSEKIIIRGPQK